MRESMNVGDRRSLAAGVHDPDTTPPLTGEESRVESVCSDCIVPHRPENTKQVTFEAA